MREPQILALNFNIFILQIHFTFVEFYSGVQFYVIIIKQFLSQQEPKVMEQIEYPQQYQQMLCQQLTFTFNRLITENRTIIRNVVLEKLSQIIKCDDKIFMKTYEKLLSYTEKEGHRQVFPINKDTKLMATKYISYFIQKNLLVLPYQVSEESQPNKKIYQSSGLTLQINSWINSFYRVFDANPFDDFEPYKNSVIEIYVKMFLYTNLYSVESIKKLMNSIKYYFRKRRSQISLNLIQKLIENPKLLKKRRNKSKKKDIYKKKFTKPQILGQIMTLIIDDLSNHFEIINQNDRIVEQSMQIGNIKEKLEKQMISSIQLLTQIICELQMDDYMDQLCRDAKFIIIFKYFLDSQYKQLANQSYRSILINCMVILGQKIALFCTKQIKMSPEQQIFQVILRLGQVFWNRHIQGEFKQPKHYFNQSVTNFILAIIEMGEIGSILQDGKKTASFKGNYYYLINKFLQPISYSFQQLFFQSYKDMESSQTLISSIKDLVYQMRIGQDQNFDSLAYLEEFQQPALYQHTRILYKLSQSFIELRSMVKKIVSQYIYAQVFTDIYFHQSGTLGEIQIDQFLGMEQVSNHNNLIFGLILNCVFSNILCRYEDWLILMQNLSYKVMEILLVQSNSQKSNEIEILRFLYLINFRLYMDDILNQQISDRGVIAQIVKILTNYQLIKDKSNPQILLYIDIVEYYYSHFNYSFQSQRQIIHKILQTDPNKYILELQLLILEKYQRNIQISLINKYLIKMSSNLKENKMSRELVCQTTIRIINIVRASFVNKSDRENMKIKLTQIYTLNQTVCSSFIKLKSHFLKPISGICIHFPQLMNILVRNQSWRLNLSLSLTKQYLQFIYALHQTFKDKLEAYFDLYSEFEVMLFQITAEKAADLDVHLLRQIEEAPRSQIYFVQLKDQAQLFYIYTFCTLLCKQKYFRKYNIYGDMPEMNPLRSLAHKSAVYLFDYKCMNIQNSVIFILILHEIIAKAPQFIDQSSLELILHVVLREANRKNKLLITDTAYLFRGKIYILFVLIIKCRSSCVTDYFNKLLYQQVDSNTLSGRNDKKIQNLFLEVFCTARNYAPHYDLPFLISNLISLLEFLGIESNRNKLIEGVNFHSKYIHFYIKLLLEATERLFKYESMKSGQANEETKLQEYTDEDEQIEAQLDSKYKNVVWITTQRVNLQEKNKSNKQILQMFVKFYQNLRVIKEKWLENVQKKLMEINTMRNINKIMEVYGKQEKKKRKIYTVIHG